MAECTDGLNLPHLEIVFRSEARKSQLAGMEIWIFKVRDHTVVISITMAGFYDDQVENEYCC